MRRLPPARSLAADLGVEENKTVFEELDEDRSNSSIATS